MSTENESVKCGCGRAADVTLDGAPLCTGCAPSVALSTFSKSPVITLRNFRDMVRGIVYFAGREAPSENCGDLEEIVLDPMTGKMGW